MTIFHSLIEALRAGYQVEEATPEGYRMRIQTAAGWARALVVVRP